jgi:hypothetical protein
MFTEVMIVVEHGRGIQKDYPHPGQTAWFYSKMLCIVAQSKECIVQ